ncbi:MAG: FKBP-type peptidyl-prolyl cis-trans isomerase [Bacteroidota bacterium]
MRSFFLCIAVFGAFVMGCGDGNIQVVTDPTIQRNQDIQIIEDFLASEGYTAGQIDTTALGVRFVILDSGFIDSTEVKIDESDIVEYDFIGRLTDGALFDSSISSVAEGTDVFDAERVYSPFQTVYTESGWYINASQSFLISGFRDGVTNTFSDMAIGGRSLIVMPSDLGYGLAPPIGSIIPQNAVLVFEFRPVRIRKQ